MRVICVDTIVTGGPQRDISGNVIGPGETIYNPRGAEIDIPDEQLPRLLKLGAVKLPDDVASPAAAG